MTRSALLLAAALIVPAAASIAASTASRAAEPIRIGITTILSTPIADRGQSEQYGAQQAMNEINAAGGVLGRPLEAYYADNACKPDVGVPATKRLIEQEHVPVIIGALCTPVTHAIEPIVKEARIPLVIATSAGQDFVDASGVGGNDYLFKTIPSEVDIARGLIRYLAAQGVKSVAVVADAGAFPRSSAVALARAAEAAGMKLTADETVPEGTKDMAPIVDKLKAGAPDTVLTVMFGSTGPFFKALESSGWNVGVSGRVDLAGAARAIPQSALLAHVTTVAVFSPLAEGTRDFVASYRAHTGLMPTQRSFFVYEAVYLVADAIRRAGADTPAAIEAALNSSTMKSRLGGTYAPDDHNHAHTPLLILGMKDGKPAVLATE